MTLGMRDGCMTLGMIDSCRQYDETGDWQLCDIKIWLSSAYMTVTYIWLTFVWQQGWLAVGWHYRWLTHVQHCCDDWQLYYKYWFTLNQNKLASERAMS